MTTGYWALTLKSRHSRLLDFWIRYGYGVLLYIFATVFTTAHFMADTIDFAAAIVAFTNGREYFFWEFGHVLWRPLGFVTSTILAPITTSIIGSHPNAGAIVTLLVLNWVFGLVAVLAMQAILRRQQVSNWAITVAISVFICTQSFLNFSQSGASYVPGLSMIIVALYVLTLFDTNSNRPTLLAIVVGFAMAAAVWLWFPYVIVWPVLLSYPLIFGRYDRKHFLFAVKSALIGGLLVAIIYLAVIIHIRALSMNDVRQWMGITWNGGGKWSFAGLPATVFGFARSFINMGTDGLLFKRFLVNDPFNRVTAFDLLRQSLWKLIAFYLFLVALVINLIQTERKRKALLLLSVAALPVIVFAMYWHGGDVERYLALLPFVSLAVAMALTGKAWHPLFRWILLGFSVFIIVTNCISLSNYIAAKEREKMANRIRPLVNRVKPDSTVFTANWQDALINFNRSFPLDDVNLASNIHLNAIIIPGDPGVAHWRETFSSIVTQTWLCGGEVWLSKRLLSPRPEAEWNWVEGDDARVGWRDLADYFTSMDFGETVGDYDGFVLLVETERNKKSLLLRNGSTNRGTPIYSN